MSPEHWRSAIGSWILWGYSWFISPSFDLHSPVGELHCLHQHALWIRNPFKLLNFLPQSHVVAGYISRLLLYEQVWWLIYSPSPLQTPWGHFSFVVLFIFVKFLSFQDVTSTFWRVHLLEYIYIYIYIYIYYSHIYPCLCMSLLIYMYLPNSLQTILFQIIQFSISCLFAFSLNVKQPYLTHR